jgi:colanic acid biosynthesis protein WcaH
MGFIQEDFYKKIIRNIPILCIDLIIKYQDQYLLVQRNQNPLKGVWWLPGGRVQIGETIEEAAKRKLIEELGLVLNDSFEVVGLYEDIFNKSSFGLHVYQTMSIVFQIILKESPSINIDITSSNWGFKDQLPERFSDKLARFKC